MTRIAKFSVPIVAATCARRGAGFDASQECYAIFGLDSEMDEGSYSLFVDRVHPEDRGDIERVVWAAFGPGGALLTVRIRFRPQLRVEQLESAIKAIEQRIRQHENLPSGSARQ